MPPMINVEVSGRRRRATLNAILDTGFDGTVCIPTEIAVKLGLELWGYDTVELADGSKQEKLLFRGNAKLMGKTRKVEMFLTASENALVGTDLLSGLRVTMDFPECSVRIKRRPSKASPS